MAYVNQGVFKRMITKHDQLKQKYVQAIEKYFPSDKWDYNYDFFSDFAFTANDIYVETSKFDNEIKSILTSIKLVQETNRNKYIEMQSDALEYKRDIKKRFDETLKLIKQSGELTEAEQDTIDQLEIFLAN